MRKALIGYTGFVGSNLLRQGKFDALFHSRNIDEIRGQSFDMIVCAGVPAVKWLANKDPVADRACLQRLKDAMQEAKTTKLVHISTVDVYGDCSGKDESVAPTDATPYGAHRLELEAFLSDRFDTMVMRLPGLFGQGLKKNIIFDFLNQNDVQKIDSRAVFQFYHLDRLTRDLEAALRAGLRLVHAATEPVSVAEVAERGFGRRFENHLPAPPPRYDLHTRHASLFGGVNPYFCGKDEVLNGIASFVSQYKELARCA